MAVGRSPGNVACQDPRLQSSNIFEGGDKLRTRQIAARGFQGLDGGDAAGHRDGTEPRDRLIRIIFQDDIVPLFHLRTVHLVDEGVQHVIILHRVGITQALQGVLQIRAGGSHDWNSDTILLGVAQENHGFGFVKATKNEVRLGLLQLQHLRRGIGLAALEGEFLDYFAAGCLDNLDRGIAVRLGPIVGMGDHRDPLNAGLAHDELAHGGAVSRARRNAVEDALFLVHRHRNFRVDGMGNDPRYAGRCHGRLDRHGNAAARVAVQIEHLVLVDELLGCGDPLGRRAGGVLLDDFELASIDPALVVDVLEVGHEPDLRLAIARCIAGERSHDADLDGGVRQAGGLIGAGRTDHRKHAQGGYR